MQPSSTPYEKLDHPEILKVLFHPRLEAQANPSPAILDYDKDVAPGVHIGGRLHLAGPGDPNILFFHGNGEIASDYDDIGPLYVQHSLSFLCIDYRGYGRSTGSPSSSAMMADCHLIFNDVKERLAKDNRVGPLVIMGRSLGCACAIELADVHQEDIAGLIIDSGFALTLPLLHTLGIDINGLDITEMDCFNNVQKITRINKPTLILHGQYDQLIPLANAEILQAQSPAHGKEFQVVPGADHNNILSIAGNRYFTAIKHFTNKIQQIRPRRSKSRR